MNNNFKYSKTITMEEIDDIMDSALRGISYWAGEVRVRGDYLGGYASEQISRRGILRIYDADERKWHSLTLTKFLKGLSLYQGSLEDVDDAIADSIIQLALFGEEVYA